MTMNANLRRILPYMNWGIIIVALLGVSVFCIVYVVNAVYEACQVGVLPQQQEDEKMVWMVSQQQETQERSQNDDATDIR